VLVEGQLATAERYEFDYVSAISDPAREANDLEASIEFFDDQPPAINEANPLLDDKAKLVQLKVPKIVDGERMHDRVLAIGELKRRIGDDKLIEGWIEGPIAQALDLRGINNVMLDLMDDPTFISDLFEFVLELETAFARAQVEAGADLIGIGDAAASLVGPQLYEQYIFPYERRLVDTVHELG